MWYMGQAFAQGTMPPCAAETGLQCWWEGDGDDAVGVEETGERGATGQLL